MIERFAIFIALAAATPFPRSLARGVAYLSFKRIVLVLEI
jgi:hypothetical protein